MLQSTSGHCSIRFSHLEDCGTFGVLVLSVVSTTKKAMWLGRVSLHCSPSGPGANSRLGQGFESTHCELVFPSLVQHETEELVVFTAAGESAC